MFAIFTGLPGVVVLAVVALAIVMVMDPHAIRIVFILAGAAVALRVVFSLVGASRANGAKAAPAARRGPRVP